MQGWYGRSQPKLRVGKQRKKRIFREESRFYCSAKTVEDLTIHNRILVIGIGNEFRSDDGVGLMIGCRIKELKLAGVEVLSLAGENGDLLRAWRNHEAVILVDAVLSGSSVGTIHRIDLKRQELPSKCSGSSSHALGLAESVELARVLGTLPSRCIFFGIEVVNVGMGTRISKLVAKAADEAVRLIQREIAEGVERLASVA